MNPPSPPAGTPVQTATDQDRQASEQVEAVDASWAALTTVFDPELCLDVVALGLVYDVRIEDSKVVVEMTLTTPGCPVSESLPEQARAAIIDATDGTVGVDIRVVWDPPWNPTLMDEAAASALGFRPR